MTRDDMVAALERAISEHQKYMHAVGANTVCEHIHLLRVLADSLREGQTTKQDPVGCNCGRGEIEADGRYASKVWIIPEPRIARRALSNEEE